MAKKNTPKKAAAARAKPKAAAKSKKPAKAKPKTKGGTAKARPVISIGPGREVIIHWEELGKLAGLSSALAKKIYSFIEEAGETKSYQIKG